MAGSMSFFPFATWDRDEGNEALTNYPQESSGNLQYNVTREKTLQFYYANARRIVP